MLKEDYVSFETAKLLKEKGFDRRYPLFPCYREDNGKFIDIPTTLDTINYCFIPAPTLQMAMKWLREKYNIHIEPRYFPTPNIYRYVIIHSPVTIENIDSHPQYFNTYEEACEAAIKYCLENLI